MATDSNASARNIIFSNANTQAVMKIGPNGIWVNPNIEVNEAARFEYPTDDHPELMRANGYDAGPTHATHWMPLPLPPSGETND